VAMPFAHQRLPQTFAVVIGVHPPATRRGHAAVCADKTTSAPLPTPGLPLLDRSVSAQHQYLGACDELQGGYGWLEEGQVLELPMLVLWGERDKGGTPVASTGGPCLQAVCV
jgi:hypothetical protein